MDFVGMAYLGAGIGAGLIVIGGAMGIGLLANAALAGMARQPEFGGFIRTSMIIAAALIEGFTFFALVITFLLLNKEVPKELLKGQAAKVPAVEEKK